MPVCVAHDPRFGGPMYPLELLLLAVPSAVERRRAKTAIGGERLYNISETDKYAHIA
jgi:hypothetical protein